MNIESKDAIQEIPWNYLQNWLQPRELAPVVVNLYLRVLLTFIRWRAIYPLDRVIRSLYN